MGIMTNQNARSGQLAFLLLAFSCLAMFQPGCSKVQDIDQLRQAAEQGDASAQYNLGVMYDLGEGVPEDDREAVKWYRLAAEQGIAGSQFKLGVWLARDCLQEMQDADRQLREQTIEALRRGRIPNLSARNKCDFVEAHAWLLVAGAQGVEVPDELREPLQRFMTRREVKQAQELAAEIFNRIEASKSQ